MKKTYDRRYFDRWYRGRTPVVTVAELHRKVMMAVATAEYFLRRTIRNVIDIGCGEASWLVQIQSIRPRVRYAGYDPSEYAVSQFGASRNVRPGSFGELPSLGIRERFDLLVCADVLHYLDQDEILRGLPTMVQLMRGAAFLDVVTREDDVRGDFAGLHRRSARWYRELFGNAGLSPAGPYTWIRNEMAKVASPLEIR